MSDSHALPVVSNDAPPPAHRAATDAAAAGASGDPVAPAAPALPDPPAAPAAAGVVSEDQVKLALRRVKDPDLSINIIDLGLVYGIAVDGTTVSVDMTLTSPGCPSGPEIMGDAEQQLRTLPGVEVVKVNLVWSPFWTPDQMEPRVRTYMGF
jgi:metal-sulfur cluster biosynthetic enzyme